MTAAIATVNCQSSKSVKRKRCVLFAKIYLPPMIADFEINNVLNHSGSMLYIFDIKFSNNIHIILDTSIT